MNPKILIGVAFVAVIAGIAIILSSGSSIFAPNLGGELDDSQSDNQVNSVLPIEFEVEDFSLLSVSEDYINIEINFKVTNPNPSTVALQTVKYDLYANDQKITSSRIGEQGSGFVVGSNYYTLLSESFLILPDEIEIRNDGRLESFWNSVQNDSVSWKVSGEAFFNLSSMTTGGENEITFEIEDIK